MGGFDFNGGMHFNTHLVTTEYIILQLGQYVFPKLSGNSARRNYSEALNRKWRKTLLPLFA